MFFKTFSAVADDIEYEASCLETIAMRNRRVAVNPLSEHFLTDLLAPLDRYDVIRRRPQWREIALDVARVIETALGRHWEIDGPCRREVYCWRRADVVERWDYPAWAQRAATNLVQRTSSIFQRGGDADADDSDLLVFARQSVGAHDLVTDAQLLSGLAIREAVYAVDYLIRLVSYVEQDEGVAFWFSKWRDPEVQACEYTREAYGDEIDGHIDRAALDYFYPDLQAVIEYRIHAEKLLMLADVSALGRLSASEASRLVAGVETSRAEAIELRTELGSVQEKRARGWRKASERNRKLSDADKALVCLEMVDLETSRPDLKNEMARELELAEKWGVSRSSIQRALGKK
ncbi:hypothetical protein [Burkholderia cepacia]|uniref:hypothetical protein n=1 Tax=Burkholderia cepacia TaxID=292 RepID=UPI00158EE017|nr:hypothetical protein [Burkholderia cepacia]